jgi:hypothetical protein
MNSVSPGVVILNSLHYLYRILIPFQFELNKVLPLITYFNHINNDISTGWWQQQLSTVYDHEAFEILYSNYPSNIH